MIYLDTASETDTNYFIALFMANNFYRIPDMRISELAEECLCLQQPFHVSVVL